MATKRLNFFKYFFTGASDWLDEQLYHRGRQKRHHQYVHGWGIASGLRAIAQSPPSLSVRVPPGLALDPNGEELYIDAEQIVDLSSLVPASGTQLVYIALLYQESLSDEVFVAETGQTMATRVTETSAIVVLTSPPGTPYVEIGRILLGAGATAITDAADPGAPAANEIDLRYTRSMSGGAVDEAFEAGIAAHHHDGLPGHPSRVDLVSETKNNLPGERVSGVVAQADQVDGLHAASTPQAGKLLSLGSDGKFPLSAIPAGTAADTVDGLHAASTPQAGKLLALDALARFPLSVIPQGQGSGLDADMLDGYHASAFAPVNHRHSNASATSDGFMSSADKQKLDGITADRYRPVITVQERNDGDVASYPPLPPGRSPSDYTWYWSASIKQFHFRLGAFETVGDGYVRCSIDPSSRVVTCRVDNFNFRSATAEVVGIGIPNW